MSMWTQTALPVFSLSWIATQITMPWFIRAMKRLGARQQVRDDGPTTHYVKNKTPTMGGLVFWFMGSLFCFMALPASFLMYWILGATAWYAIIGLIDDGLKIKRVSGKGLSARWKSGHQLIAAVVLSTIAYYHGYDHTQLTLGSWHIPLGVFFIPWASLVFLATTNAVNLTDGLDGLAIVPCLIVLTTLAGLAVTMQPMDGHAMVYVVLASAMLGAGFGFLWFNTYPACVFMGDVGALCLGAMLAAVALSLRLEWTLVTLGSVFVLETLSVIIQVLSYRWRGKRVFRMAPLHHHFELQGLKEPQIIVRFWLISLASVALTIGLIAWQ